MLEVTADRYKALQCRKPERDVEGGLLSGLSGCQHGVHPTPGGRTIHFNKPDINRGRRLRDAHLDRDQHERLYGFRILVWLTGKQWHAERVTFRRWSRHN